MVMKIKTQKTFKKCVIKAKNKFKDYKSDFIRYHSSDIDYEDFVDLLKKYTAKPYSFSVVGTTLASDNERIF